MSRTSRTRDDEATAAPISKIMTGWLESPNGNLVRGSARRKTDEFPGPATVGVYRSFVPVTLTSDASRVWTAARYHEVDLWSLPFWNRPC
jgi:hypothetical protein